MSRTRLLAHLRRLRRVVAATRFEAHWPAHLTALDAAIALLVRRRR